MRLTPDELVRIIEQGMSRLNSVEHRRKIDGAELFARGSNIVSDKVIQDRARNIASAIIALEDIGADPDSEELFQEARKAMREP